MAQPSLDYEQFVIVAEDQWKLTTAKIIVSNHTRKIGSKFTMFLAGYECECTFTYPKTITLEFKGFARGRVNEVHLEILICDEKFKLLPSFPMRQMLTIASSIWTHNFAENQECVLMTIRVLKDRPFFPDFTSKDVQIQIGGLKNNAKLRVGDSVFYVNKEFLSAFSPYFNKRFNEDKCNEVELTGETETKDPALFHDFLMSICLPNKNFQDALPNVNNVAGLLALAQSYQVDLVRDKCEHHLKFCREMPAADRFVLAKKYGLKDVLYQIVREQKTLGDCQELIFVFLVEEI